MNWSFDTLKPFASAGDVIQLLLECPINTATILNEKGLTVN